MSESSVGRWRRLHGLRGRKLTRDQLLLKLGAAKKEAGRTYTLGGPENPTWKAILHTIAHACGYDKSEKPVLPVPALALHGLAALLDRYAFFPVTRDQLTMLLEGNVCDGRVAFDTFGIEPVAFAAENLAYLRKAPRFRTAP